MEKRRAFLKIATLLAAGPAIRLGTEWFSSQPPELSDPTPNLPDINGVDTQPSAGITTQHPPEPTIIPKETSWQIPATPEIIQHLNDPDFFITPRNDNRTIFTRQFDPNEYQFPANTLDIVKRAAMNNSCGPASIATILKTYHYLQTGTIPNISVGTIIDALQDTNYEQKQRKLPFIEYDGTMRFTAVKFALEKFTASIAPITTIPLEGINIPEYFKPTEKISPYRYPQIIESASQNILQKGGLLMAFFFKYNYGHFSIFTNLWQESNNNTHAFVVDPRGHENVNMSGGNHSGIVKQVNLSYYIERGWLFSLFGVIPDFNKFSRYPLPQSAFFSVPN